MRVGDVDSLVGMLASDVAVHGDGGGTAPQWSKPIAGASNVSRLLAGLGTRLGERGGTFEEREVNGEPGAVARDRDGRVISIFVLELAAQGPVQTFRSVINPDKLRHLVRRDRSTA